MSSRGGFMKLNQVELRSEALDIRIAENVGGGSSTLEIDLVSSDGYVLILLEILAGRGDFLVRGVDEENGAETSLLARQRTYILKPAREARSIAIEMLAGADSRVRATIACFKRKIVNTSKELSRQQYRALSKLLVGSALTWMGIQSPEIQDAGGISTTPSVEQMRELLTGTATAGTPRHELLAYINPDLRAAILNAMEETMWLLAVRDRLYTAAHQTDGCCMSLN
jgi:hypothetical protein